MIIDTKKITGIEHFNSIADMVISYNWKSPKWVYDLDAYLFYDCPRYTLVTIAGDRFGEYKQTVIIECGGCVETQDLEEFIQESYSYYKENIEEVNE